MVSDTAALYLIHPHRSKEAFAALIDGWAGILVSDGYGVYQKLGPGAANVLGPPHPERTGLGGSCPSRPGGLWDVGLSGTATAVSYGHSPTHGRGVAGVVCPALQAD